MNNTSTISSKRYTNYKKTAIGIIPIDWEVMRLGETGKVVTGNTPSRTDLSLWNGDFCWATAKDFKEKYINDTVEKITEKGCNGARLLPKGAILITCIASIGNNAIAAVPLATNQQINSIIVSDNFNNEWLYYQLDFYKQNLELLASKTAVPLINKSEFEKLKLPIPPLPEQQKIAEILSTWDEAIANCKTTINTLKARNKGLAQQLLSGKKRLNGFKDKWQVKSVSDLFTHIKKINDGEIGHSIMTISAKSGFVKQQDKFDRVIAGDSLKKYTQLKKYDFAYNKGNSKTYQMGCIYQLLNDESALVPFVYICFEPKTIIDPSFYKFWFLERGLDNQLKKIITSGARGDGLLNVNSKDFFSLQLPFLNKEEQTAIAQVLETADQELKCYQTKLEALQLQKKGLMQQLLTGKIRVNVK